MGYAVFKDPDPWRSKGQLSVVENDTATCCHCGRIVKLVHDDPKPWRLLWEQNVKKVLVCRKCIGPGGARSAIVCAECSAKPCDPMERKLQKIENASRGRFFCDGVG